METSRSFFKKKKVLKNRFNIWLLRRFREPISVFSKMHKITVWGWDLPSLLQEFSGGKEKPEALQVRAGQWFSRWYPRVVVPEAPAVHTDTAENGEVMSINLLVPTVFCWYV